MPNHGVRPRVSGQTVLRASLPDIRVVMDGSDMILVYEPKENSAGPCLVLESKGGRRELKRFPADWRTMPEKDLLSLRAS